MKIFNNLLIVCLLLILCGCNQYKPEEDPYKISQKQIEYAQSLLEKSVVISANWKDFKNLEVTVKPEKLGRNDDNDNDLIPGQFLADAIATNGHKYVGKNICVSIIYPDKKEVGYACVKNEYTD